MGRSVHMHEALVLISILLATVMWGILGALLVVPVLASLGVIFDYLRRRRPASLEEPVGKVVFILLTTNERLLLATVISRCQRVELLPLTVAEVESALNKGWGY
jgi:hypothetical protein